MIKDTELHKNFEANLKMQRLTSGNVHISMFSSSPVEKDNTYRAADALIEAGLIKTSDVED